MVADIFVSFLLLGESAQSLSIKCDVVWRFFLDAQYQIVVIALYL